jgi:hypothetical protein
MDLGNPLKYINSTPFTELVDYKENCRFQYHIPAVVRKIYFSDGDAI